jgi:hypothetical protein
MDKDFVILIISIVAGVLSVLLTIDAARRKKRGQAILWAGFVLVNVLNGYVSVVNLYM